jgi:tripartite-type tricarboxylate transporter receptor subunit TctC
MRRHDFLNYAATVLATGCMPAIARANAYPTRPVRLVIPHPPGVGVDVQARVLASELSAILGQPAVVENRPGIGTLLATDVVAKAEPDGYTLGLGVPSSLAAHPRLHDRPIVDVERAIVPVGLVWTLPWALYVHADVRVQTLAQFVDLARSRPDALTYASTGVGSFQHLTTEWLASLAGMRLRHIPYGTGPWTSDLLSGRVDAALWTLTGMQEHVRSGKLRALAISTGSTGGGRADGLPEVPTFAEAGVPGFSATAWTGMVAPSGTPPAVIDRLVDALALAAQRPAFRDSLVRAGGATVAGTPAAFAALLQAERIRWRRVVADAGIRLE